MGEPRHCFFSILDVVKSLSVSVSRISGAGWPLTCGKRWKRRYGPVVDRSEVCPLVSRSSKFKLAHYLRTQWLATPSAGKSGWSKRFGSPQSENMASAARYPLRTAPSIVAGHPVAVQSPARNRLGSGVRCEGRQRSAPGCGEKVAAVSFTTVAFRSRASRDSGRTCCNSPRHSLIIS